MSDYPSVSVFSCFFLGCPHLSRPTPFWAPWWCSPNWAITTAQDILAITSVRYRWRRPTSRMRNWRIKSWNCTRKIHGSFHRLIEWLNTHFQFCIFASFYRWPVRLIDRLIDWLADWVIENLIDWLIDCLIMWTLLIKSSFSHNMKRTFSLFLSYFFGVKFGGSFVVWFGMSKLALFDNCANERILWFHVGVASRVRMFCLI